MGRCHSIAVLSYDSTMSGMCVTMFCFPCPLYWTSCAIVSISMVTLFKTVLTIYIALYGSCPSHFNLRSCRERVYVCFSLEWWEWLRGLSFLIPVSWLQEGSNYHMETAWPIFLSEQKGEEVGMLQFTLTITLLMSTSHVILPTYTCRHALQVGVVLHYTIDNTYLMVFSLPAQ